MIGVYTRALDMTHAFSKSEFEYLFTGSSIDFRAQNAVVVHRMSDLVRFNVIERNIKIRALKGTYKGSNSPREPLVTLVDMFVGDTCRRFLDCYPVPTIPANDAAMQGHLGDVRSKIALRILRKETNLALDAHCQVRPLPLIV